LILKMMFGGRWRWAVIKNGRIAKDGAMGLGCSEEIALGGALALTRPAGTLSQGERGC
jgi:hypothetical protein